MDAVPVDVIGIDRFTRRLIELLDRSPRFRLAGLADQQPSVLREYESASRGWQLFDDPRELILRSGGAIVFVWNAPLAEDTLEAAVEKGKWLVLRTAGTEPLRNLGLLARKAARKRTGALVWTPWIFRPSFESGCDWAQGQDVGAFTAHLATPSADLDQPALEQPLAALTYPDVFLARRLLGTPRAVFCHEALLAAGEAEAPPRYHCALELLYDRAVASLTGSLDSGPMRHDLTVCTPAGVIEMDLEQSRYFDRRGNLVSASERYPRETADATAYERHLEAIWQAYQEKQPAKDFELKSHLVAVAVVQAAAISTRTGHPEDVLKVTELGDFVSGG